MRGFRREKTDWFPGSGKAIPQLNNFVYNNKSQIKHFQIDEILNSVLNGYQINDEELKRRFAQILNKMGAKKALKNLEKNFQSLQNKFQGYTIKLPA